MFATKFNQMLQIRGITAYKVAKETGLSQGSMNQYKNGGTIPSLETIVKIANYLKCSVDELVENEEKKETLATDREGLTSWEQSVLTAMRLLPEAKQAELALHIQDMLAKQAEQKLHDSQG